MLQPSTRLDWQGRDQASFADRLIPTQGRAADMLFAVYPTYLAGDLGALRVSCSAAFVMVP
jgi:hypothetical protein